MAVNDYVLYRGLRDTRSTLALWQREPGMVLRAWFLGALAVSLLVLGGTWMVASLATPDIASVDLPGVTHPIGAIDIGRTLFRNSLVLAFHATACVAGFIAGSSIPLSAEKRTGFSRWVHERAGELAIALVVGVTIFSLCNQIYFLGSQGSTLAAILHVSPGVLTLSVLPHALIELTAVFLPLAAWIHLSRKGEWSRLLAATFVTVGIAIPMLIVSAFLEAYMWPEVLRAISPVVS